MKLLGISGYAGAGKDTLADALVRRRIDAIQKLAFADPLKKAAQVIFGFTHTQLWGPSEERNKPDLRFPRSDLPLGFLTPRFVLEQMGTECGRALFKNVWVDALIRDIGEADGRYMITIVTDVRFENEVERIREVGGKVVRLVRPGFDVDTSLHRSVRELGDKPDDYFDDVLVNGSTPQYVADIALDRLRMWGWL